MSTSNYPCRRSARALARLPRGLPRSALRGLLSACLLGVAGCTLLANAQLDGTSAPDHAVDATSTASSGGGGTSSATSSSSTSSSSAAAGGASAGPSTGSGEAGGHVTLPCKDSDCDPGMICGPDRVECVPGCTAQHACDGGRACCKGLCRDLMTAMSDCGACGAMCSAIGGDATCDGGACSLLCDENFDDCDEEGSNGCETNLLSDDKSCGVCGLDCNGGEHCEDGTCQEVDAP